MTHDYAAAVRGARIELSEMRGCAGDAAPLPLAENGVPRPDSSFATLFHEDSLQDGGHEQWCSPTPADSF
jgi:hypothetical protein